MADCGSAADALDELADMAGRAGKRNIRIPGTAEIEDELAQIDRIGAILITFGEPAYPVSLAQIDDAPPALCVRGNPEILQLPGVRILGARNASANGRRIAETIAGDLAAGEVSIVSSLARGIDTAAHNGANRLIREGATLVRNAEDILEVVRPMLTPPRRTPDRGNIAPIQTPMGRDSVDSKSCQAVIGCLSPEPVAVDEIVRQCQLTAPVVRTILLELELAGRLERHPGNRVAAL